MATLFAIGPEECRYRSLLRNRDPAMSIPEIGT
jgi:hypothetical protein